ncbi:hypothetical protein CKA32_004230 [Geitlerinema sp. FC II]|nr:hypothetical protein CKA32_004230 [Geitlerinema sp. FC II]
MTFSPANWQGDSWFVDPPLNLQKPTRWLEPTVFQLPTGLF